MAGGLNALGNLLGKVNANGALVVALDGGTASATKFLAGDGTAAAPSYSFANDPDLGLYLSSAGVLGVSVDGAIRARFQSGAFDLITDSMALRFGAGADVSLSRGAANTLLLASGDIFAFGAATSAAPALRRLSSSTTLEAVNGDQSAYVPFASSRFMLNGGDGNATSTNKLVKKVTGIADAVATDVITVTVPNANQAAAIQLTFLASTGSTDAFESSRVAEGAVILARTTGVATVAVVSTLELAQIATVAAGATLTLAYGVSAMTGAAGATQTFTIQVTLNDSGNVGSNQCVVLAEVINSETTGVTIA